MFLLVITSQVLNFLTWLLTWLSFIVLPFLHPPPPYCYSLIDRHPTVYRLIDSTKENEFGMVSSILLPLEFVLGKYIVAAM